MFASLGKSPGEDNSEGEYLPRSSLRFSGHKIPCGNFPPEKTLRYCRPSWGKERDLASEATYDA